LPAHWEGGARARFQNAAAANFRSPSEGVAGGGGWGEESRHARAKSERGRTRRPARQSRATQKSFLFLLEEKIGRAQIRKSKENFFVGRAGFRHGGGTASLRVLLKVGSSKVQNFPPDRTFAFWERDCLAASPLGSSASREAGRGRIPRRIERKGNGIMNV